MCMISGFGIRVMLVSQNELESVPSCAIFWNSFRRIGVNSSLNIWQNSPVKPSGVGLLFVGNFKITDSISLLVIGLFAFSISSWFSLRRLQCSNLSISSGLSILLTSSCSEQSLINQFLDSFSFVSAFLHFSSQQLLESAI